MITTRSGSLLASMKERFSLRSRNTRAQIFLRMLKPRKDELVLDLGGGKGRHIAKHLPELKNVCIADFNPDALRYARENFGYNTLHLDGTQRLPLEDQSIDIVFCSSVVEHVTGPESRAVMLFKTRPRDFDREGWEYQSAFAAEIRRVAKRYFVQTPNKYFMIEAHTWIPFLGVLGTSAQWRILRVFNHFWPRRNDSPDWRLLTYREMRELFPDAEIVREKRWGMTKSFIAVKREASVTGTSWVSRNAA